MTFLRDPCSAGVVYGAPVCRPASARIRRAVLAAAVIGSAMAFIDGGAVNVALPVIQGNLRATSATVQWVVEGYLLFLSALLLVGGAAGDHFGRRRTFVTGAALFGLASVACALSAGAQQLIAARMLQGIGAALLIPGSLALIGEYFTEGERGSAIGSWSAYTSMAGASAPLIGGWLAEHFSWRWIFLLNIPLAAALMAVVARFVPPKRGQSEPAQALDWRGATLITFALAGIVYGLMQSQAAGSFSGAAAIAGVAGAAALITFPFIERRAAAPLIPVSLFRSRSFSGVNALTVLLYAGMSGALFFVPFNLMGVQRYSATAAGAALLPIVLTIVVLSRWAARLATRVGPRGPLTAGPLIAGLGFALFALPGTGGSYWTTFFPAALVLGIGMAVSVAPLTTVVMTSVTAAHTGLASGINNLVARTAGLVAIAVFALMLARTFDARLAARLDQLAPPAAVRHAIDVQQARLAEIALPPNLAKDLSTQLRADINASFVDGFRSVMLWAALLSLAAGVIGFATISASRRPHSDTGRASPIRPPG